nr:trinucleotide repeat-containing gene 18 protein-like [Drosophila kikkawai]
MDGQGHPPTPAPTSDTAWMYCAVDELLQALQGAGPSPPRPSDSLAGPLPTTGPTRRRHHRRRQRGGTTAGNHAGPRRPSTGGCHPWYPLFAGLIGPRRAPLEVVLRDDDEEEAHQSDDAGLQPAPLRGMPPQAPLRAGHIGPQAPSPEVALRDGNDEEENPATDAEDAWNRAVSLSDDWVNFDRLVEDTLGDLVDSPPHAEPPATGSLGPLGARYDPVSDDEGNDDSTPRHYDPTADGDDDSDATVIYDPTAEDSHTSGRVRLGSGTNTASTISADEDEASRDGRQSDASRPPSTGPADDASASTISADEDETSQDSGWSNAPRSPPPRWTPPSTTPLQSWAPATTGRSRSPPPSYEEIFGLGPYPGPHATARCAAVTASRDPRPRLPTIAELAAEEARRRAEDLSEELGNPPVAQPPTNGPPPSPTPRRRARRRSAPWADSPPSSSDESSLDADEGALDPPRWVPAPVEWTTPNGTLPAALLRRIHGRLATPRRRTIRILEEEANQRFRVQINRSGKVIITLHPSRR